MAESLPNYMPEQLHICVSCSRAYQRLPTAVSGLALLVRPHFASPFGAPRDGSVGLNACPGSGKPPREVSQVIHWMQAGGPLLCCSKKATEVPAWDRFTPDRTRVTCAGATAGQP